METYRITGTSFFFTIGKDIFGRFDAVPIFSFDWLDKGRKLNGVALFVWGKSIFRPVLRPKIRIVCYNYCKFMFQSIPWLDWLPIWSAIFKILQKFSETLIWNKNKHYINNRSLLSSQSNVLNTESIFILYKIYFEHFFKTLKCHKH